ncbi:hypothetical protein RCL1_006053 [Eukaryota sp. TZLM3-RCL]
MSDSSRLITSDPDGKHYSPFVAGSLMANYIVGTGVLGLPFVFALAGVKLSLVSTIIISFISYFAWMYLAEAMARADAISDSQQGIAVNSLFSNIPKFTISNRKYELPHLCQLFVGEGFKIMYQIAILGYMASALVSYASTSAGSLMTRFPVPGLTTWGECDSNDLEWSGNCYNAYLVFLSIYAVFVLSLTMVELSGQGKLQSFFTIYRLGVLALCAITISIAIFDRPYPDGELYSIKPHIQPIADWQFSALGKLLPNLFFASIGHHSLPGLLAPLQNKNKAKKIIPIVVILLTIFYLVLAEAAVLYFGKHTPQLLTLVYGSYPWGYPGQPLWAKVIREAVVLFVPIVCLSAYPINAITLGNNLFESILPPKKRETLSQVRINKVRRISLLIAGVPPVFVAIFARKLSIILSFGGLFGFYIALIVPAILHLKSREACISNWNASSVKENPFTTIISSPFIAYLVIYIGIGMSINTTYSLIKDIFF